MDFGPLQVALSVARALDQCGLRYVVGGSVASSLSGEPRSTLDVDLVVAIRAADVEPLLAALGDDFHADAEAVHRAVRQRPSVNVFHHATSKVDLFVGFRDRFGKRRLAVSRRPDEQYAMARFERMGTQNRSPVLFLDQLLAGPARDVGQDQIGEPLPRRQTPRETGGVALRDPLIL